MHRYFKCVIFAQVCLIQSLASPDSCYYCMGTPQCAEPMDYDQVSPRTCLNGSVCLKYISSSKHKYEDVGLMVLTYRQCFIPELLDETTCTFIKTSEENELLQLNRVLIDFECTICNSTNCNLSSRNIGSFLTSMVMLCLFLNILSFILLYDRSYLWSSV